LDAFLDLVVEKQKPFEGVDRINLASFSDSALIEGRDLLYEAVEAVQREGYVAWIVPEDNLNRRIGMRFVCKFIILSLRS